MTRDQWKERLPLIQAYAEGKTIQVASGPMSVGWQDAVTPLDFDLCASYYRIKPEPRRFWAAVSQEGFVSFVTTDASRVREWVDACESALRSTKCTPHKYTIVPLVEVVE